MILLTIVAALEEALQDMQYSFIDFVMDALPHIILLITSFICGLLHIKNRDGFISFTVAIFCFGIIGGVLSLWQFLSQNKLIAWCIAIVCSVLYIIKYIYNIKQTKEAKKRRENKNNQDLTT